MALLVDLLTVLVILLGVYAEVRRGLFLTFTDVLRLGLALVAGFGAYSLIHRLTDNHTAGFVALAAVAFVAVMLVNSVLVATFLATTVAPGMTPPDWSTTTPVMDEAMPPPCP